jgi:hypothetical protein
VIITFETVRTVKKRTNTLLLDVRSPALRENMRTHIGFHEPIVYI